MLACRSASRRLEISLVAWDTCNRKPSCICSSRLRSAFSAEERSTSTRYSTQHMDGINSTAAASPRSSISV